MALPLDQAKRLNPQIRAFLDKINALPLVDPRTVSVADRRKALLSLALTHGGEPIDLRRIEDVVIPAATRSLRARVYTPRLRDPYADESDPAAKPLPILLYFHGGGWHAGSLGTHDGFLRRLAKASDCIVVSVDYGLAPEHPAPAGVNDAVAVYSYMVAGPGAAEVGGNAARVGLGGDSAGGTIAAAACQVINGLTSRGLPAPAAQVRNTHGRPGRILRCLPTL
jgi:acetyl esterase